MNIINQFTNSIWNFKSYHSLAKIRGGKSFLYIFLLFTLVFSIFSIKMSNDAIQFIGFIGTAIEEDVPDFSLSDGKFTFEGSMPYIIEEDGFVLIIDTTGETNPEDLTYALNGLLITEDSMVSINAGLIDVTPFSTLPINFNKDTVVNFLPNIMIFVYIFLFIWYLISFGGKLFGILILTLIAMIGNAIFNEKLTFGGLWNIAIYASTFPILFKLVHNLMDNPLSGFFFFIYWTIAITYVFLAIYNISKTNHWSNAT